MSQLLRSIVTVIDVFYNYCGQDEECDTMCKKELKELLEKEMGSLLKNPNNPDTVDVFMQILDRDHDRRVDFTEYLLMVFKLTMACNKSVVREYCHASGSRQKHQGHHLQEAQSETEEQEESTGQESDFSHSSWSSREGFGSSKSGQSHRNRGHRHGSSSTGWERNDSSYNSGHGEGSGRSYHRSRSSHSESSSQEKYGFKANKQGGRRHKLSISPSRISGGEEYESGTGNSGSGQSTSYGQHESSSGHSSSYGQHGSG
uniref:EF-hand domain-containing protein n=1 Tax=Vombatus ursinus TaxID=29139 RepID=A0A4X2LW23_VOMUR